MGASSFARLVVEAINTGLSAGSVVSQSGTAAYEGDLTRLLGIPWSEDAPIVDTTRAGVGEAERTTIELAHDRTATQTIRPYVEAPLIESATLLLHDSFGVGLLKHLTPFFADRTTLAETHIDYDYVRPLLADAETILLEKVEHLLVSFVLDERLSSKMVSAFLEELNPVGAAVAVSAEGIEVEGSPPAESGRSVYLVVEIDRTVGSVFEVWTSATGPDEVRELGGFRNRVAWQVSPDSEPIELHGFPPDVGIDGFFVTVDAP